jgi:hypothetical protein
MTRDPIVDEVRAARDELAADHDYDLAAIFATFRAMAADSDVERVTLPRRPVHLAAVDPAAAQQGVAADDASRRS